MVIGIDTGGTFTDFVVIDENGALSVHKEPSTPDDPARAVLAGLRRIAGEGESEVVHGSTVATNSLLERRGAVTVLITTAGFEDVLEIGRQTRSDIYDLDVTKPPPLVAAARRWGVTERVGPDGNVVTELDPDGVRRVVARLQEEAPEAVAICLLHSYANPDHERRIVEALTDFDGFVTASHDVLPEFREYERCSTTAVNAYVGPVMSRYLARLADQLDPQRVRIMQSNGGTISLDAAQRFAVQTILSGPAGGAVGGFEMGRRAGYDHVITFDMGGTSTDVGLSAGELSRTTEAFIGDLPIRVPVIDIHTVGAGGGSIAYRDPGGSLRVGPRSAGAEPGPICYDRGGTELTVTDANLFLGRLSPEHFLGGAQRLPVPPVRDAMTAFADRMGLSPTETAEGIVRVANATMERAIRVISLERGFDPRDFTLVCFGGAGAMHAAELAANLGIPRVLVPPAAGILSAWGMLMADFIRDYSQTLLSRTDDLGGGQLDGAFHALEERARAEGAAEGFGAGKLTLERSVDMRYTGQGYELSVPMGPDVASAFHEAHDRRYGYADRRRSTEVVNVRVRAIGPTAKPTTEPQHLQSDDPSRAVVGETTMTFAGKNLPARVLDRTELEPGHVIRGPALIVEYSTTTVVPPEVGATVDGWGNLVLSAE